MRVDREVDFHHHTVAQMRDWLDRAWAQREWDGLRRVRIIHGRGAALPPALRTWCDEKGIPWSVDPGNPGVTILHPGMRRVPSPRAAQRPLAELRKARPPARRALEEAASPRGDAEPDLMAAEFERLAEEDRRRLLGRKHAR